MKVNKRDNRIEKLRIIAMILVIIVHVTNRFLFKTHDISSLNTSILILLNSMARISVPLFFMISGIVNIGKKYDKKKYTERIIRTIIILIIWTLIYYTFGNYKVTDLFHAMFSYLKPILWYMYALIGLYIVTPFITKMVTNLDREEESLYIKLWLLITSFGYLFKIILGLYGIDTNITHPVPLLNAAYYLGYYIIGYIVYKHYQEYQNKEKILTIIMYLALIINAVLTFILSIKMNKYYQTLFGYANILISVPAIIFLILSLNKFKNEETKIVKYISPYTFGIYLSHVLFLDKYMEIIKINNIYLGVSIYSILTLVTSYVVIFLIKRIPVINKYIC